MVYYQHGFVRLPVVGLIAVGFIVGGFFGAKLVPHVPLELLRIVFGVLLLYLGFAFMMSPRGKTAEAALPAGMATAASSLVAYLLRRRQRTKRRLPPPTDDRDYHI